MTPYFSHSGVTLYCGSSLDVLRQLPEQSVHCVVTSPPYWGLRDYSACGCSTRRHAGTAALEMAGTISAGVSGQGSSTDPRCRKEPDPECEHCHGTGKILAMEGQLGLEQTPAEYVDKMVDLFREAGRVMRDDGTLWLNMGDGYATGTAGDRKPSQTGKHGYWENPNINKRIDGRNAGLKPKDLVGIPWMLAFALRDDGWYLRSDIIWHKANPMPESVTDRPTKAHEYIFLLSKSPHYYYDHEAIKEPSSGTAHDRARKDRAAEYQKRHPGQLVNGIRAKANGPNSRMMVERAAGRENSKVNPSRSNIPGVTPKSQPAGSGVKANQSFHAAVVNLVENRNKRSVWTVATAPYRAAHFATFPPALIRPCILAGCPVGGTVLDPFFGSGTTGMVALELGRKAIGVDLNPEYCALAEERCRVTPGLPL